MMDDTIISAYLAICEKWRTLPQYEKSVSLERFKLNYSYNSGAIENPEITLHDTEEVFDKDGVSNFTGDVRTIYEINNLKHAWSLLSEMLERDTILDQDVLLKMHRVLTLGTYDEPRWKNGERPGSFKVHDYRVANDVGLPPKEAKETAIALMAEIQEAISGDVADENALTIAAYAHARLVDIHPFADGNGRVARMLTNYILMHVYCPPCSISVSDRMAYFGALDAFHADGDLEPFKMFIMAQILKSWAFLLE